MILELKFRIKYFLIWRKFFDLFEINLGSTFQHGVNLLLNVLRIMKIIWINK